MSDPFAEYEDIAVDVVADSSANTDVSLDFSNREMAEIVCQTMNWEDFDLFGPHDFTGALTEDVDVMLAYAFIAFLRWRVFTTAAEKEIGPHETNLKAIAHSEYWYMRLVNERQQKKDGVTPKWLH